MLGAWVTKANHEEVLFPRDLKQTVSQDPQVADPAPQETAPKGLTWLSLFQQNIPPF